MKPMTSTEINSAARIIGEERAVELYAKAGFDAWDFSMFEMCSNSNVSQGEWSREKDLQGKSPRVVTARVCLHIFKSPINGK